MIGGRRQHERGRVVHRRRAGDRGFGVGNDDAQAEARSRAALRAVGGRLGVDRVAGREVQLARRIDRRRAVHLGEGVGADGVARHGRIGRGIGRAGVARELVPGPHRRARAEGDAAARAGERAVVHQHLGMRVRIEHAELEHAKAEAGDIQAERGHSIEGDRSRLDITALHVDDRVRASVHQVDERGVLGGVGRGDVDRHVAQDRDVAVDLDRLGAVDAERAQRERRARRLDAQHIVDRRQIIRQDLVAAIEHDVQRRPRHGIRRAAEAEVDGERIPALAADRNAEQRLRVDID